MLAAVGCGAAPVAICWLRGVIADHDLEQAMLRWTIPFLVAMVAAEAAVAADEPIVRRGVHRAASKLPAGLPRPHYKYRTTVTYDAPYPSRRVYVRPLPADDAPDVLFTPADGFVPYIPPFIGAPLLPGSSTLPGYYGRAYDYDYQGPYYGGPYVGYWDRLPYACGVYGYC
jgi:hypothetical protein